MLFIFWWYEVWNFLFPHNHGSDDLSYLTIGSVADLDLQIGGRSSKKFPPPRVPPLDSPMRVEGSCTPATKPYGCGHKCARNPSVQAVLTTALLAPIATCKLNSTTIYSFRTIQSIQTTLPSQRCYNNDVYYLDNLKTPFQLTIEDKDNWSHSPKIDENDSFKFYSESFASPNPHASCIIY